MTQIQTVNPADKPPEWCDFCGRYYRARDLSVQSCGRWTCQGCKFRDARFYQPPKSVSDPLQRTLLRIDVALAVENADRGATNSRFFGRYSPLGEIVAKELLPQINEMRAALEFLAGRSTAPMDSGYLDHLYPVMMADVQGLITAEKSYGNSWKLRGGVDTYHMIRRKWERLETAVAKTTPYADAYDIFQHLTEAPESLLDAVRDLRRYLLLTEAEVTASAKSSDERFYLDLIGMVGVTDIDVIRRKEQEYGASWKKAGGIGAFMMLARKWDRIKQRVSVRIEATDTAPAANRENILEHIRADRRQERIIEDIRDLRGYLLLVEAEMVARGHCKVGTDRDNKEAMT
jgi:hypothetical protein